MALPPEATKHTEAGALAFVRYYLMGLSKAEHRGDASGIAPLTSGDCSACLKFIGVIESRSANGQHIDREALSIANATLVGGDPTSGQAVVGVLANDATKRVVDAKGDPVQEIAGAKINFEASVKWGASGWTMQKLVVK